MARYTALTDLGSTCPNTQNNNNLNILTFWQPMAALINQWIFWHRIYKYIQQGNQTTMWSHEAWVQGAGRQKIAGIQSRGEAVTTGRKGLPFNTTDTDNVVVNNKNNSRRQGQSGNAARTVGSYWLKEHSRALTSGNLAQSAITEHVTHMSHMSSIGKRPRWWTPTHDTTRDVHLSRGTSGQRPPQWTETMATYHRLTTPSSTTRANYTPHTRPHSVLSIFNCILSLTSSQLLRSQVSGILI